jgi:hypothetical protein
MKLSRPLAGCEVGVPKKKRQAGVGGEGKRDIRAKRGAPTLGAPTLAP